MYDWVVVRRPASSVALPLVTDLGPGEREVLALALELPALKILSLICDEVSHGTIRKGQEKSD
jgi:hypothetical protein